MQLLKKHCVPCNSVFYQGNKSLKKGNMTFHTHSQFLTFMWLVSLHSLICTTYVTSSLRHLKSHFRKSHFLSSHLPVVEKKDLEPIKIRTRHVWCSYYYSVSAYMWHIIHSHGEMHSISVSTKVSTWQAVLSLI